MTARIAWAERRFDFTFPVDFYPELIERLRGTPARLAARLQSLPPARVSQRVAGKWSMQEHAGHLTDLDLGLFLPRLDDYEAGAKVLRAADMENAATEQAAHNARPLGEVLAHARTVRDRVVAPHGRASLLTLLHDRVPKHTISLVRGGWPGILEDLHRTLRPGAEPKVVAS